jgi:hypothetical protein
MTSGQDWFSLERFECSPLAGRWAVARLRGSLGPELLSPPSGARLVVQRGSAETSHGAFLSAADRRWTGPLTELLWIASFAIPLEVVQAPGALFELSVPGYALVSLPSPWSVVSRTDSALGRTPGGFGSGHLLRRSTAVATALAVSASSTWPVVALAAGGPQSRRTPSLTRPDAVHPANRAGRPLFVAQWHVIPARTPRPATPVRRPLQIAPAVPAPTRAPAVICPPPPIPPAGSPAATPPVADSATTPPAVTCPPPATPPVAGPPHKSFPDPRPTVSPVHPKPTATPPPPKPLATPPQPKPTAIPPQPKPTAIPPHPKPTATAPQPKPVWTPPRIHERPPRLHPTGGAAIGPWLKPTAWLSPVPHPSAKPSPHAHRAPREDEPSPAVTGPAPLPTTGVSVLSPAPPPLTPAALALSQLSAQFASVDQPPPFLVPIYKRAAHKYHVPWTVLAAINSIETDYGRNLNVSSAGAMGWMQFMPATWAEYGVSVDGHGPPDPNNPRDAIFAAAHYLAANGARHNLRGAIFAYNHATWYVNEVVFRANAVDLLARSEPAAGVRVPHTTWNPMHKPIARWIVPVLRWASRHGWSGTVTSGYRTFRQQVAINASGLFSAAAGTSNHETTAYPGGAVDVTNPGQLIRVLASYPRPFKLVGGVLGPIDPEHFSATGR